MHQQLGHWVAIKHDGEDGLHGLDLALVGALLELIAKVIGRRHIGSIVLMDQAVGAFEESRHFGRLADSSRSSSTHVVMGVAGAARTACRKRGRTG